MSKDYNVLDIINNNELYRSVFTIAKKYLSLNDDVHGIPHTLRVLKIALKIAKNINKEVDLDVLVIATLLHDIGRPLERIRNNHHAIISAEIAKQELRKLGLSNHKIERIIDAIRSHSFSLKYPAKTIEAKILSDADKIDAIGAIGIARAFVESARRGRNIEGTIEHFNEKLVHLVNLLFFEESRKVAKERHMFMLEFLRRLRKEMEY